MAGLRGLEDLKREIHVHDPLGRCYLPQAQFGRIMYMDFPFQIFQTPQAVAITFEWSLVFRLIYTDGSSPSQRPRESPIQESMSEGCGDCHSV